MRYVVFFTLFAASLLAHGNSQQYSISPSVGSGSGSPYTVTGDGRITAVRMWEVYNGRIYGFQIRYGSTWAPVAGYVYGHPHEIQLFDDEAIIQISGKYGHYLDTVQFITNRGRSLRVGQPFGHSFNMYPDHKDAELRFVSGRYHGGITSIQAHWAIFEPASNSSSGH